MFLVDKKGKKLNFYLEEIVVDMGKGIVVDIVDLAE